MTDKLSAKQEAFVLAYLESFDATKAAISVGAPVRSASQRGYELRHNPLVAARISEELGNRGLPPEAVLTELRDIIRSPDERFSARRFDPGTGELVESRVDLNPKIKAIELYAKAHGLLTDRVDLSGTLTAQVQLVGIDEGDI